MSKEVSGEGYTHEFQIDLDSSRLLDPNPPSSRGQRLNIQIELEHVKEDGKSRILNDVTRFKAQEARKPSDTKTFNGMNKAKNDQPNQANEIQTQEPGNNHELEPEKFNLRLQKASGQELNSSNQDIRKRRKEQELILKDKKHGLEREETMNQKAEEGLKIETEALAQSERQFQQQDLSRRVQYEEPKEEPDNISVLVHGVSNPETNSRDKIQGEHWRLEEPNHLDLPNQDDIQVHSRSSHQFPREFQREEDTLPSSETEKYEKRRSQSDIRPFEDNLNQFDANRDLLKRKRIDFVKMSRFAEGGNHPVIADPNQNENAGQEQNRSGSDLGQDLLYNLEKVQKLDDHCVVTKIQSDPMPPHSHSSVDKWTDSMLDARQDVQQSLDGNQIGHPNQSGSEDTSTSSDLSEDQFQTPTCCFWKCM